MDRIRQALDRFPVDAEVASRTWTRFREVRAGRRDGGSAGLTERFGSETGCDGERITRRRLHDGFGVRYRVRHRILLQGDDKRVDREIAQYRSTSLGHRLADVDGLLAAMDGFGDSSRTGTVEATREPPDWLQENEGPQGTTSTVSDGHDVLRCSEVYDALYGSGWRNCGWLDDARAASGVQQFRHTSFGSLTGENPGWAPLDWGSRVVALYDSPFDFDWRVFQDAIVWAVDGSTSSEPHGMQMAGVVLARGEDDPDVEESWHTGMAPGAAMLVVNPETFDIDESPGCWLEFVAQLGADVLVNANSRYRRQQPSEYYRRFFNCFPDNPENNACNQWEVDERGTGGLGRPYADAIDAVFAEYGLQVVFSAGNCSGMCYRPGYYSIGLGRSAFSAITVGAIEATEDLKFNTAPRIDASMTPLERARELQEVGWVYSFVCGNYSGPTGDGRVYPLLLGYSTFCGVPANEIEVVYGDDQTATLSMPEESYYLFAGTSPACAQVGGAYLILKEWLDLEFPSLTSDDAPFYRLHLLNMGDRSGAFASSDNVDASYFASTGLPRHGGFGKLRLRLADRCHFNDGGMEFHSWEFDETAETYVAEIGEDMFGALPADLARIRVALWFEIDSADVEEALDRPAAFVLLQRKGKSWMSDWETVAITYTGEEYIPDSDLFRDNYLYNTSRLIQRDPHANIALDNGWNVSRYPRIEGDANWRVLVFAVDVPNPPARVHLSVIWETGDDPSLAENRRRGWFCSHGIGAEPVGRGTRAARCTEPANGVASAESTADTRCPGAVTLPAPTDSPCALTPPRPASR